MMKLKRLTTEYVDFEDRIRLTGEASAGERVVLWLPQRLLQRMLPVLLGWLEPQAGQAPHTEVLQGFAQQAARAELPLQAPVTAEAGSAGWLVHSVDITQTPQAVRLTFCDAAGRAATVTLATKPLRQWLNIVHDAYSKAEWPRGVWPEWVREGAASNGQSDVVLH